MVNLIRKDMIAMRGYYLFAVGYALIFGLFTASRFSPMLIVAMPACMLTIFSAHLELRNRSMLWVSSLPVRRQQIVLAKYVLNFAYLAIGIIMVILLYFLNEYVLGRRFPIDGISFVAAVGIALAFTAIYYPLQYGLGVRNSHIVSFLTVCLTVAAGGVIGNLPDSLGAISPATRLNLLIGIPVIGVVLLAVSYNISLRIFLRKDIEG